jgi:hypothetical protein
LFNSYRLFICFKRANAWNRPLLYKKKIGCHVARDLERQLKQFERVDEIEIGQYGKNNAGWRGVEE